MGHGTGLSLPLLSPCPQNKSRLHARRSPWAEPARLDEALPPGEESPEALLELLRDQHSPWALPPDCSPQDRLLREVAALAPELLHGSRVFQAVKSLRILDKGVSAAAARKAVGQETLSSCCEGKHPGKRTPSHPRVFPRAAAGAELLPTASPGCCANPCHTDQHVSMSPWPRGASGTSWPNPALCRWRRWMRVCCGSSSWRSSSSVPTTSAE